KLAAFNAFGNSLLLTPITSQIIRGHSRIYHSIDNYGWWYLPVSLILYFAFTETMVYWIHRALHLPRLYRHIHKYHHRFHNPTPWVSFAFHPVDAFAQALPNYLFVFIFPINIGIYLCLTVFLIVWTVMIHDQLSFVTNGAVNNTGRHTIHHRYNDYNFGQYFTLWDRIGKTLRDPQTETRYAVL